MTHKISFAAALHHATQTLKHAGISRAAQEAQWLLAAHLDVDVSHLWQGESETLLPEAEVFHARLQARAEHKPLSRIMGRREFWRHTFVINDAVLDPRPDSEWLLEAALRQLPEPPKTILDLGTGSGALLLSALQEWPKATGLGIDISATALDVARHNATQLGCEQRVEWQQQHWIQDLNKPFDLILCNPPYITTGTKLSPAVTHDPRIALFAENAGLADWQEILASLHGIMHQRSLCIGECAPDQTLPLALYAFHHGLSAYSPVDQTPASLAPHRQIGLMIFQTR